MLSKEQGLFNCINDTQFNYTLFVKDIAKAKELRKADRKSIRGKQAKNEPKETWCNYIIIRQERLQGKIKILQKLPQSNIPNINTIDQETTTNR